MITVPSSERGEYISYQPIKRLEKRSDSKSIAQDIYDLFDAANSIARLRKCSM